MYKAIYLAKRNPALTMEAFPARWRQHSLLAGTLSGLKGLFTGVTQCARLVDAGFPQETTAEFDAVNLIGLSSLEAGTTLWELADTKNVMEPDELQTFSRPIKQCWLVASEEVLVTGPPGSVAVIRFLKRKPELDARTFREDFAIRHCEMERQGAMGKRVVRQVLNAVVQAPPPGFEFDVVSELWFADAEAARRYHADSEGLHRVNADRAQYCDEGGSVTFTARVAFSKGGY